MVLLQRHHPVLEHTGGLRGLGRRGLSGQRETIKQILGSVKKVNQKLEAGIRSQVNTIWLEGWSGERTKQTKVGWALREHGLGKGGENLGQSLAVPQWSNAVHRR